LLKPHQPIRDFQIRLLSPDDAARLNGIDDEDNVFDENPALPPSGALALDGGREFLADASVLFWVAEVPDGSGPGPARAGARSVTTVCFYEKCGFASDESEILVKALG